MGMIHSNRKNILAGFTLPTVIIVMAAVFVLAIGALTVTGIERATTRAGSDFHRAELAVRAGLEEFRGLLHTEASNDDFMIIQAHPPVERSLPHLFLVRGKAFGEEYQYRFFPLFTTAESVRHQDNLSPPQLNFPLENELSFRPSLDPNNAHVSWRPIINEEGKMTARYAYWVEDLQGKLDPKLTGNQKSKRKDHIREPYPFPAPGLNASINPDEFPLDQVALYAIEPNATSEDQKKLAQTLHKNRDMLISPGSSFAAAEVDPLLQNGALVSPYAEAIRTALTPGLAPYQEQPNIPFSQGLSPTVAGKPKLNLNELLTIEPDQAVVKMANHIKTALPHFEERKGGFPDDYLKTLAANTLDYADADNNATTKDSSYRGLDSYPLVSEFLMRFRWENLTIENNNSYLELSVATYAELWNMTDQPISGSAELTHDTKYKFTPYTGGPEISLEDADTAQPTLAKSDDFYWLPAVQIELNPNQYKLIKFGEVRYRLDLGTSSQTINQITLRGETSGVTRATYKLKWNGRVVDHARGKVVRADSLLRSTGNQRQAVRATIPGHIYGSFPPNLFYNMGDVRMSFYIQSPQVPNAYPDNYSPNRRNIRFDRYVKNAQTTTAVENRIMPSEWPDGGHNSAYEPFEIPPDYDDRWDPDSTFFFPQPASVLVQSSKEEAPMRISNRGRFYSTTELGRIYDPIMWDVEKPPRSNLPWGDVENLTKPDTKYGGGNTLRIGRPEHPKFSIAHKPGREAFRLLDLFHVGLSRSPSKKDREGKLIQIRGHVNLNTASRDVLRALAIGHVTMDPKIAKRLSEQHDTSQLLAPPVEPFSTPEKIVAAEATNIAEAILTHRKSKPFASPSELAKVKGSDGEFIFGNKKLLGDSETIHRTDSATEEVFARVYEASTVRSRNFRIWVIGQIVEPVDRSNNSPRVLAETRKAYTVFADPGNRDPNGQISSAGCTLKVLHEVAF